MLHLEQIQQIRLHLLFMYKKLIVLQDLVEIVPIPATNPIQKLLLYCIFHDVIIFIDTNKIRLYLSKR